jgi:hypothetical protein
MRDDNNERARGHEEEKAEIEKAETLKCLGEERGRRTEGRLDNRTTDHGLLKKQLNL